MQDLKSLATFEGTISGIPFKMRRRSTAMMLTMGMPSSVFGQMAVRPGDTPEENDAAMVRQVDFMKAVCDKALLELGGESMEEHPVLFEDLAHIADGLASAFIGSGLDVDPTPESLEGRKDS